VSPKQFCIFLKAFRLPNFLSEAPFWILPLTLHLQTAQAMVCHQTHITTTATQSTPSLPANVSVFEPGKFKIAQVGLPAFLNSNFPYFQVIQSLVSHQGGRGTGVHIGDGYVLTNRHVYTEIAGSNAELGAFHGSTRIASTSPGRDLSLLMLPTPSPEDTLALNHTPGFMRNIRWNTIEKYNDWAILHDPKLKNQASLSTFRRADSLKAGETLWILGHPDIKVQGQIAAGSFEINHGNVSMLKDTDLQGGFSGSPVVDSQGHIVGLVFGFHPLQRRASFMNIEAVLKDFSKTKPKETGGAKPVPNTSAVPLHSQWTDNGKKQTVVFINGNGDSLESFSLIQNLMPKDFNYLSYDQRG